MKDGWGEYRLTINHTKGDGTTIGNLAIHSLTAEEMATGISAFKMGNEKGEIRNAAVYNLSGQRLATPAKGINIVNGKVVVMK